MTLSVREKEHWKERIEKKIEERIFSLIETNDRNDLKTMERLSREQAIEALGLKEFVKRETSLELAIETSREELAKNRLDAVRLLYSLDEAEIIKLYEWDVQRKIESAIEVASKKHERQILNRDELGRTILKLRDEKDCLLDTIWLATSTKQIRDLWQNVANLLDQEPTELQSNSMGSTLED